MHVLPLPFGLALALLPRGEADKLRRCEKIAPHTRNTIRIPGDIRYPYFNGRGHI
ncbi:MAG TPA: hypothetical protein VF891_02335 [Gaiellaceae bacterium]